jgi:uncharacterized membrane protein YagU involved in acid resistance
MEKYIKNSKIKAIVWSGIIAGMAFMMVEMILLATFTDQNIFNPVRMMAAIVMGKGVLPMAGSGFSFSVMMVAMMVHLALSIMYAGVLSLFISKTSPVSALMVGSVFGIVLYLINFYGFTSIFPWFAMARNWMSIVSHIMFGMVAAGVFVIINKPTEQIIEKREDYKKENIKTKERIREKVEF